MKAIKYVFDKDLTKKVVDLPDDVMVMPIHCRTEGFEVLHSESKKRWYVIGPRHKDEKDFPDVDTLLLHEGHFTDCSGAMYLGIYEVPFIWGKPLQSKYRNGYCAIPIWQSVPSGWHDEEDCEIYDTVYKLIKCYLPKPTIATDTPYTYNLCTQFEVIEYHENDIHQLVKDIEHFTGIRF